MKQFLPVTMCSTAMEYLISMMPPRSVRLCRRRPVWMSTDRSPKGVSYQDVCCLPSSKIIWEFTLPLRRRITRLGPISKVVQVPSMPVSSVS